MGSVFGKLSCGRGKGNNVTIFRAVPLLLCVLVSSAAWAHGGPIDGSGCHKNRAQGGYHCHSGALKGETFASREVMLKELHRRERQADTQRRAGR
jgi:hypothetical protein